jgi:hypothetical protein
MKSAKSDARTAAKTEVAAHAMASKVADARVDAISAIRSRIAFDASAKTYAVKD